MGLYARLNGVEKGIYLVHVRPAVKEVGNNARVSNLPRQKRRNTIHPFILAQKTVNLEIFVNVQQVEIHATL